jgi:hypothetical protein
MIATHLKLASSVTFLLRYLHADFEKVLCLQRTAQLQVHLRARIIIAISEHYVLIMQLYEKLALKPLSFENVVNKNNSLVLFFYKVLSSHKFDFCIPVIECDNYSADRVFHGSHKH